MLLGTPSLKLFSEYLDKGAFDDWRTLRLFRNREPSGSLMPLSPVTRKQPAVLFTANHTANSGFLECTADIYAKYASVPKVRLCCKVSARLGLRRSLLALARVLLSKAHSRAGQPW